MENSVPSSRRNFLKGGAIAATAGLSFLGMTSASAGENGGKASSLYTVPRDKAGDYLLPDLPYAYDALEPSIDAQTMRLHHDIHHNGYVKGLNKTRKALAEARSTGDFDSIKALERDLAFHGSGHMLHSIFWQNMAPAGTTRPSKNLSKILSTDFGSLDAFKAQFTAAASKVEGSGWGILAYQPMGNELVVLQAEKHQNLTQWGVVPVLVLDVWEHAYYLKYQNKRGDYVKAFWDIVNWDDVEARLSMLIQSH